MNADLEGLAGKLERALATRPEYYVTLRAELRPLHALSDEELRDFANARGWRVVKRIGGRQIEFYNDAGLLLRDL